ncbi:hypothetical protein BgiMline_032889 [Biomphalaria glabrata]
MTKVLSRMLKTLKTTAVPRSTMISCKELPSLELDGPRLDTDVLVSPRLRVELGPGILLLVPDLSIITFVYDLPVFSHTGLKLTLATYRLIQHDFHLSASGIQPSGNLPTANVLPTTSGVHTASFSNVR